MPFGVLIAIPDLLPAPDIAPAAPSAWPEAPLIRRTPVTRPPARLSFDTDHIEVLERATKPFPNPPRSVELLCPDREAWSSPRPVILGLVMLAQGPGDDITALLRESPAVHCARRPRFEPPSPSMLDAPLARSTTSGSPSPAGQAPNAAKAVVPARPSSLPRRKLDRHSGGPLHAFEETTHHRYILYICTTSRNLSKIIPHPTARSWTRD